MEELDEIKELRKQIREMLLDTDLLKKNASLTQRKDFSELKTDCYKKMIDLKHDFESPKEIENKDETIIKIDELIGSLKELKNALGNRL
jgi:hypothetical protein